jgi:hypothetical protein
MMPCQVFFPHIPPLSSEIFQYSVGKDNSKAEQYQYRRQSKRPERIVRAYRHQVVPEDQYYQPDRKNNVIVFRKV